MPAIPNHRCTAEACERIVGGPSTGKTELLVKKIGELISEGCEAGKIAVACASPSAAEAFEERLAASLGEDASLVDVRPARAFVMDLLAKPEAVEATGRDPRILCAYETAFLMEDVKTSGLRPRRLKEMLKFFYRTWTELGDWEDGWLLEGEESGVHALIKQSLSMVRGILEPEAANLAVSFLANERGAEFQAPYEHAFVDDYQDENRATQIFLGMLASKSLTIAGDPNGSVEVYDSYPFAQGLDDFAEDNGQCKTTVLTTAFHSKAVHEALENLARECAEDEAGSTSLPEDAAEGEVSFESFPTPSEEFDGVAGMVREAVESGIRPQDVFVAAPNKAWARNVAERLNGLDVPASTPNANGLAGDVRDRDRCGQAMLACALRLVADPTDDVSWRAWCGFGDYLAHSNGVLALRSVMDEEGLRFHDALARIAESQEGVEPGALKLLPAYEFALKMVSSCAPLEGEELFSALVEACGSSEKERASVAALCEPSLGGNAADMAKRLEKSLLEPRFEKGCVRVGPVESLCGQSPRLLAMCGFLDGFIPCRSFFDGAEMPIDKQERERARLARLLATMLSKAQDRLVCTHFEKTDLETAEMMKIRVKRIRLEDGVRIAVASQSVFAKDMRAE